MSEPAIADGIPMARSVRKHDFVPPLGAADEMALFAVGYAEAEPFARKTLKPSRKEFGPDHPKTGILLNNLALLYQDQGRHSEAEPLFRRALAIVEKAIGPAGGRRTVRWCRE